MRYRGRFHFGNIGTAAGETFDQATLLTLLGGLWDHRPADAQLFAQLPFGRQSTSLAKFAADDELLDLLGGLYRQICPANLQHVQGIGLVATEISFAIHIVLLLLN